MSDELRLFSTVAILACAVVATAITCVYARHESRKQFTQLQVLIAERDTLEVEWGKLQIEQSTLSNHGRVEQLARTKMKMHNPVPAEIRMVKQ
jgi:cell division protein FtsL